MRIELSVRWERLASSLAMMFMRVMDLLSQVGHHYPSLALSIGIPKLLVGMTVASTILYGKLLVSPMMIKIHHRLLQWLKCPEQHRSSSQFPIIQRRFMLFTFGISSHMILRLTNHYQQAAWILSPLHPPTSNSFGTNPLRPKQYGDVTRKEGL